MKFTYAYKTSDGKRHEASMEAKSREEVFETLRVQGIKAIKVVAADGSKANGEIRGVRKRVVVASIAIAALAAGVAAFLIGRRVPTPPTSPSSAAATPPATPVIYHNAKPLARQTINGDRQRIEAAAKDFTNAAERLMAAFAEPGRPVVAIPIPRPADAEFETSLREPIRIAETDFTETIDLKRIVAKIKADLRAYLADGGDIDGYLEELAKRQKLEVAFREKAERHLARLCDPSRTRKTDKAEAYGYWLKANAQLQSMGIYTLPLPDALRGYEATLDLDE